MARIHGKRTIAGRVLAAEFIRGFGILETPISYVHPSLRGVRGPVQEESVLGALNSELWFGTLTSKPLCQRRRTPR